MATYVNGKCVVFHAEDWTPEQLAAAKAKTEAYFASGADWLAAINDRGADLITNPYHDSVHGPYGGLKL
jgi:hypothetical protein